MSKKRQIIFCDAFCVEIGHESSERHQKSISFDNILPILFTLVVDAWDRHRHRRMARNIFLCTCHWCRMHVYIANGPICRKYDLFGAKVAVAIIKS